MDISIRIDNVHIDGKKDADIACSLERIEQLLHTVIRKEDKLMALSQESLTLIGKFDAHTSRLAALIQELLDRPNTTESEFRAALQPIADNLELVGKVPTDPIPPVDPVPPVTPF